MAKKTTRKSNPKKTTTKKAATKSPTKKTAAPSASSKKTTKKKTSPKKPAATGASKIKKKVTKTKSAAGKKTTSKKTTTTKKKPTRLSPAKSTPKKTTVPKTTKKPPASTKPKKPTPPPTTKPTGKSPGNPATTTTKKTTKKKTTKRSGRKTLTATKPNVASLEGLVPDKDGYVLYMGRRVRLISTKNVVKKKPVTAVEDDQPPNGRPEDKPVKTKLPKRDLDRFRDLLRIARAEKLGDLSAMEAEALRSSGGNLSTMPIHMADIGTDVYDQDFMLGLAAGEREVIREIDAALQRIENKTYGMCLMTGQPIPKARLNAKPWAKYTIEAARMIENGQFG